MGAPQRTRKRALLVSVPLIIFILLLALMFFGLNNDPRTIPSALIGKPAPTVMLPDLQSGTIFDVSQRMQGRSWLLNIWASWCTACRVEHPAFLTISETYPEIAVIGLNYKDTREDALAWLEELGDPYQFSVVDSEGRVGIEFGVYGVPETFVIDAQGSIVYKHIGPLAIEDFQQNILPLL